MNYQKSKINGLSCYNIDDKYWYEKGFRLYNYFKIFAQNTVKKYDEGLLKPIDFFNKAKKAEIGEKFFVGCIYGLLSRPNEKHNGLFIGIAEKINKHEVQDVQYGYISVKERVNLVKFIDNGDIYSFSTIKNDGMFLIDDKIAMRFFELLPITKLHNNIVYFET